MAAVDDAPSAPSPQRQRLLSLLHDGDIDAALRAGLMDYPCTGGDGMIQAAQARLHAAWAARERFRARDARLARRAAERAERRAAPRPVAADAGAATVASAPARPALPAAAAAALARAQARAAGRTPE